MRNPQYTRQRYACMLHYLGRIMVMIGMIILSPLVCLIFFPDECHTASGFILPGLVILFTGFSLTVCFSLQPDFILTSLESCGLIVLCWVSAIVSCAVPFILTIHLNFHQAFFESTSGWTTTGLSVVDVRNAPHIILFFRSILQYAGGAGFVIMALSLLEGPIGRPFGAAEGREDQLVPNIRQSARLVFLLYGIYTVMGIFFLRLAGMHWFDAVNHSFTAISTGGFSTKAQSIGFWNSPAVEAVIIFLMLLGSLNFLTVYMVFKGRFKFVLKNPELRLFLCLLFLCLIVSSLGLFQCRTTPVSQIFRIRLFDIVSALSTTGFTACDAGKSNSGYWFLLTLLMLIGGGTGSTAGGIKQYRIYVMLNALMLELKRRILPDNVISELVIWQGEQRRIVHDPEIRQIGLFVFFYLSVFLLGSLAVCSHGFTLEQSLFETASTLGTVGLSAGVTSANTPALILWCQSMGMLFGRLEFYAVIAGTIKLFRDIRTMF